MHKQLTNIGQQAEQFIQRNGIGWIFFVLLASNTFTYHLLASRRHNTVENANKQSLFLMDEAARYVSDLHTFEQKVREVSYKLQIPPEWLMTVIYSESKFDTKARNHKGSGAVGLIQWMPSTARDFGLSSAGLLEMNHLQQLDYVYEYLDRIRAKYGAFGSITELYLAILYPKAVGTNGCYTLYAKPSVAYKQNAGLDANKDGTVTVKDIEDLLRRKYAPAFQSTMELL